MANILHVNRQVPRAMHLVNPVLITNYSNMS